MDGSSSARCREGLSVTPCAKVTQQHSDGHLWPAEMVQQHPWHLCWWGGEMEQLSRAAEFLTQQPSPVLHVWFAEPGRKEPCAAL